VETESDSALTRFLARLPLLPHSLPLLSRIAKCAKSAKASAASSSIRSAADEEPELETEHLSKSKSITRNPNGYYYREERTKKTKRQISLTQYFKGMEGKVSAKT